MDIQGRTLHDVTRFVGADPVFIDERIRELEREWDLGRAVQANAASLGLIGLALGFAVNRKFLLLPAAMLGLLLQQSMRGSSPAVRRIGKLDLRKLGIRSARDIQDEIIALRILRGDFLERADSPERALRAARNYPLV